MDALSSVILRKALDGLAMRQMAVAQNVAGATSRGYRPIRVDFERALATAAAQGNDAVEALPIRFETMRRAPGAEPRTDLDLATASETALRYSALVDVLGRQMSLMRLAVKGGQ